MSGPLENPRHERFAQGLAKGLSATEAYEKAGYKPDQPNSSRLTLNDMVRKRVEELQSRIVENVILTKEWVIERLIENANRAMQAVAAADGEYKYDGSVANKALELLGKEVGMFVDRAEVVNIIHAVSPELPTAAEWEREHSTAH